jgi:hypothetical protein
MPNPIPMTDEQIQQYWNEKEYSLASRGDPNPIVRQPDNHDYGPYRVLRRADGLCAVLDTRETVPPWPLVFRREREAREAAGILWEGGSL